MKDFIYSKKRLALLSGFLLAFLVVLNISTFVLYKRAKAHLDNGLGERLRSVAVTLSHAVEYAIPESLVVGGIDPSLYALLHMVRAENLLSNIVILTADGRTVVDLDNLSPEGEPNPFIELDYGAVTLARSGLPAYTNLYKSGDIYMKSAYAPITSQDNEIMGIIGVEAGASYFETLKALGNAIIVVDGASVLMIVLLGIFFYRQSVALDRAQAAIIQGENLATMGRMVAGIAHEIRNPLSIIKTSAERLANKHCNDDEVLSYISEEVDNLNRILTGYLNFAKAERQEHRAHSLHKTVSRCLMMLEPEIQNHSATITAHLPEHDISVVGDDKQIQQALLNILLNALQAVEPTGRIEITVVTQGKSAHVTVKDDGEGIPEKHLKEITKPFFTTKKHGSGLGMSIVSNIIDEHGGQLVVRSTPGTGTEVTISLPLASAA